MNKIKWICCLVSLIGLAVSCRDGQGNSKPNIVLIIADDVSWDDIGAYGNTHIRTPNLDRLAAGGLRFDNVFLTTSSCSPSRISILTGRYPHNTGAAELHTETPSHLSYFPELLKDSGYFTALAGKWHEGKHTARAYDTLLVDKQANGESGAEQWLSLLEGVPTDKPFFFWLASYDAHREWSVDSAFKTPYAPEDVRMLETLVDDEVTRQDLASYYNEISRVDEYVGQLVKALGDRGQLENTIILFMADNGRAFPGSKTRLYDRGIKTPFIVHWPKGILDTSTTVEALVSSIDIAPTILQVGGVESPKSIQGSSFARLFSQPREAFRNYVFAEHNWHDYEAYERAVRTRDYLYILNERPGFKNDGPIDANQSPSAKSLKSALAAHTLDSAQHEAYIQPRPREEFYDNREDPLQLNNLADDDVYGEVLVGLRSTLERWQKETGDTLPDTLTGDWYHRETGAALPAKGRRGEMPGAAHGADTISKPGPF